MSERSERPVGGADEHPDAPDQHAGVARDASGLVQETDRLEAEGFTEQMTALEGAEIRCGSCRVVSPAGSFEVAELQRLEGASDPGDSAVVVALTCPSCGAKGTLTLMYGPEASAADSDALLALQDPAVTNQERRP